VHNLFHFLDQQQNKINLIADWPKFDDKIAHIL